MAKYKIRLKLPSGIKNIKQYATTTGALIVYTLIITAGLTYLLAVYLSHKHTPPPPQTQPTNDEAPNTLIAEEQEGGNLQVKSTLILEKAETEEEIQKGLSGRDSLEPSHGMLFIFDTMQTNPFWMKDMKFPLDMLFIDNQMKVVDIIGNAQPCKSEANCPPLTSKQPYQYVIEINANEAAQNNIELGDTIITTLIQPPTPDDTVTISDEEENPDTHDEEQNNGNEDDKIEGNTNQEKANSNTIETE